MRNLLTDQDWREPHPGSDFRHSYAAMATHGPRPPLTFKP